MEISRVVYRLLNLIEFFQLLWFIIIPFANNKLWFNSFFEYIAIFIRYFQVSYIRNFLLKQTLTLILVPLRLLAPIPRPHAYSILLLSHYHPIGRTPLRLPYVSQSPFA